MVGGTETSDGACAPKCDLSTHYYSSEQGECLPRTASCDEEWKEVAGGTETPDGACAPSATCRRTTTRPSREVPSSHRLLRRGVEGGGRRHRDVRRRLRAQVRPVDALLVRAGECLPAPPPATRSGRRWPTAPRRPTAPARSRKAAPASRRATSYTSAPPTRRPACASSQYWSGDACVARTACDDPWIDHAPWRRHRGRRLRAQAGVRRPLHALLLRRRRTVRPADQPVQGARAAVPRRRGRGRDVRAQGRVRRPRRPLLLRPRRRPLPPPLHPRVRSAPASPRRHPPLRRAVRPRGPRGHVPLVLRPRRRRLQGAALPAVPAARRGRGRAPLRGAPPPGCQDMGRHHRDVDAGACVPNSECAAGEEFEKHKPGPFSDRVCEPVTRCVPGDEYETNEPTPLFDRVCAPTTSCVADEYEYAQPTDTTDRVCAARTQCDASSQYEFSPGDATSDRVCRSITQCDPMRSTSSSSPRDDRPRLREGRRRVPTSSTSPLPPPPPPTASARRSPRAPRVPVAAPTETSDRVCAAVSSVRARAVPGLSPTETSDRVCARAQCDASNEVALYTSEHDRDTECAPRKTHELSRAWTARRATKGRATSGTCACPAGRGTSRRCAATREHPHPQPARHRRPRRDGVLPLPVLLHRRLRQLHAHDAHLGRCREGRTG